MNQLDVTILVAMGGFAVYGVFKGMVRLMLGFFSFALGILLAAWLGAPFAATFEGLIENDTLRSLLASAILFFAALLGCGLLGWFIHKILKPADLLWADRVAGGVAGAGLAVLLAASAMVPLTVILPPGNALIRNSRLAPHVLAISSFLKSLVPRELRERYEAARQRMQEAGEEALPGAEKVREGVEALKERRKAGDDEQGSPPR